MLNGSLVHSTARWCGASVPAALAHLSSAAGMQRWNLGLWNCREVEPGLFTGQSLFDGASGWLRVRTDAQRSLIDYLVGSDPSCLAPRIRASVIAGQVLGYDAESCVITLEAWRTADMPEVRWRRLMQTHETEIELICAQLAADAGAGVDAGAGAGADVVAAPTASDAPLSRRRHISSGSPWEELAGYSRAVVDGDWVFVSGTVGQNFTSGTMQASAADQANQALDTIAHALEQAGAALMDVVRVRVFVPAREDVAAVSGVLKQRLGPARPTNTTVCCPLAVDGAKVEIEVTARRAFHPS